MKREYILSAEEKKNKEVNYFFYFQNSFPRARKFASNRLACVELAEIRCSSDLASVSWLYFATKEKNFAFDKFTTDFRQRKTLTTS